MLMVTLGVPVRLELVLLAVFGWWGFTIGGGVPAGIALGALSTSTVAVLWGLFLSPKARITLPELQRRIVEILVFLTAAAMMTTRGHLMLATALVTGDVVVLLILHRLGRDTAGAQRPPQDR
jgi:hypothetical protein